MGNANEHRPPRRVHLVPRPEDAEIGDVIDGRFFEDDQHALAVRRPIVFPDRFEVWTFVRTKAMCVLAGGSEYYTETLWQRVS
jgi:hypothetical protein